MWWSMNANISHEIERLAPEGLKMEGTAESWPRCHEPTVDRHRGR